MVCLANFAMKNSHLHEFATKSLYYTRRTRSKQKEACRTLIYELLAANLWYGANLCIEKMQIGSLGKKSLQKFSSYANSKAMGAEF